MKTKQRILSVLIAAYLIVSVLPTTVLAAWVDDNPAGETVAEIAEGDIMDANFGAVTACNGEINHNYGTVTANVGVMSYNYGTIAGNDGELVMNQSGAVVITNNGVVYENSGTVETNVVDAEVKINRGTVTNNAGNISDNLGTVTNNTGTITNNFCGIVNGGTVENNYIYKVDTSGAPNVYFYSEPSSDLYDIDGAVYLKEGVSIEIGSNFGYVLSSAPVITSGTGTITDNGDGTYTLAGVTSDLTLTANTQYAPVEDITGVVSTVGAKSVVDLNDGVVIMPESAGWQIGDWEIVDAGTTGASLSFENPGLLSTTAVGTIKVKAIVANGKSETEDFTKEFTITVVDTVQLVYEAYTALQTALAGDDLDELKSAAEDFEAVLELFDDLNEEQLNDLGAKLGGVSGEEAWNMVFADWVNTNILLETESLYWAYLDDPTAETAADFTEYYDLLFNDPNDEVLNDSIRKFIPDIDDVYADAVNQKESGGGLGAGGMPESEPTEEPVPEPTAEPTEEPVPEPTAEPTEEPAPEPTAEPTEEPTPEPTAEPTEESTPEPTAEPTEEPTPEPTAEPTEEPTPEPTAEPTEEPTPEPTAKPTEKPTPEPTPNSNGVPVTGDDSGLFLWIGFAAVSLAGLVSCVSTWRRRRSN